MAFLLHTAVGSCKFSKKKTTHLEVVTIGGVGVPEEGRRRDGFIVRALVDFFALQRNIGRRQASRQAGRQAKEQRGEGEAKQGI